MANDKYDNLTALMASGQFNWPYDYIAAALVEEASFDRTDALLGDLGVPLLQTAMVPGREMGADGAMLGWPVVFNAVEKDRIYQVVFYRDTSVEQRLLAWYDVDENDEPITIKNNGSLTVRPQPVPNPSPPILGTWIGF